MKPTMSFTQKKTFGIALGGGGARALVHIGILDVLQKEGIKINAVSGTSMGAIIGGIYAMGTSMETLLMNMDKYGPKNLLSLKSLNLLHESLVKPRDFEKMLKHIFNDQLIENCNIPFNCTAVDIESGELIILNKGLIREATRASASIPSLLPPVFLNNQLLVDGGVLDNVPLFALRKFKTDIVMGVKVNNFSTKQEVSADIFRKYYAPQNKLFGIKKGFFSKFKENWHFMTDVTLRTLEIATSVSTNIRINDAHPDMLLTPDVSIGLIEANRADEAIDIGREIMKKNLPELKKLLA